MWRLRQLIFPVGLVALLALSGCATKVEKTAPCEYPSAAAGAAVYASRADCGALKPVNVARVEP